MPFHRLVVVDLATLGAAPQIATFFGDLGARVIKVEHPRGDGLRQLVDRRGVALQWKILNRNKECVTLDVARAAGRELLERMLERADLLITNLTAERLGRWRLDGTHLSARHPRLLHVNLTAYGTDGPWAERPGSGTLAEAAGGLAGLTGEIDGPPTLSPVGLGDYLGAMQGILSAVIGLYARDAGGAERRRFDVAMHQPVLSLLSHRIATAARDGEEPGRHGNRFPNVAPRNTYRTADRGWVALSAGTDEMAARLFRAIGRPELADDARFGKNLARLANADALDEILVEWIGARSLQAACDDLVGVGVSAAPVEGLLGVAANPHFRSRGDLVEIDDEGETLLLPAPMPPGRIRWLGRARGADNRGVYADWLGIPAAELERLVRDRTV